MCTTHAPDMGGDGAGERRWRGARRRCGGDGLGKKGRAETGGALCMGVDGAGRGWGVLCCRAYMMVLGVQNVHNACGRQSSHGQNGGVARQNRNA